MAFNFSSSQSLFGQTQTSLFNAQPQSQQSLFGAQPPQSQQSLFGASQQPQSQTSLFGAQSQPQTSLFGAPAQASQPSLFGAPQQPQQLQSQPSLFANAIPQSQPGFGNIPNLMQPAAVPPPLFATHMQSNLFASPPSVLSNLGQSASLFQTQPTNSLFAQQQSAPSLFAPNQPQQQQPGNIQTLPQLPAPLLEIIDRLNPLHPSSPFQAALYNVVPPTCLPRYTKPEPMHSALWQAALTANPDPSRQVPVHANGFDDLYQRFGAQSARIKDHTFVLSRMQTDLNTMQQDVNAQLSTKLAAYRRLHRELARKVLRIASSVELAAARADTSGGLSVVESEHRKRLEVVAKALATPAEFKDKLSDLVEVVGASVMDRNVRTPVMMRDERAAKAVRDLLADQLKGIQHLGTVCSKIERDLAIMNKVLQER